jgi:polar amino acid transport system substrate-binding protein
VGPDRQFIGGIRRRAGILAAALCLATSTAMGECVLRVRLDADPPYLIPAADGAAQGLNADLVKLALAQIGCRAEFHLMPFARALKSLATGDIDVVPDMFRNPERESYAWFSHTTQQVPNALFIRKSDAGKWSVHSLEDLPRLGIRLAIKRGVLITPDFDQLAKTPEFRAILETHNDHLGLWRMLLEKRVDAVVMDRLSAQWELRNAQLDHDVVEAMVIAAKDPSHFGFSRKTVTEEQVNQFDLAMHTMLEDGTVAKLIGKYGLDQPSMYRP